MSIRHHFFQILPIAHHPTSLELPEEVSTEIERFKSALRKCFKKNGGQEMVFFERNYKSQHLQLQVRNIRFGENRLINVKKIIEIA
jgi:hypothetical protein